MKHFFTFFVLFTTLLLIGVGCAKSKSSSQGVNQAKENTESFGEHKLNETESNTESVNNHELNGATDNKENKIEEQEPNEDESDPVTWSTYTNPRYEYSVSYPSNWYYTPDACCPPPPTFVVFNNVSDVFFEFTPNQWDKGVCAFDIYCGYEGTIESIAELQARADEGETYAEVSINGFPAAQLEDETYYVVDGVNGCRITTSGGCPENTSILNSFSF